MKNSSDIPGAREILLALRARILTQATAQIEEINRALEKMTRASPDKRTRVRHKPPTPAQVARIKKIRRYSDLSVQQIAQQEGLNSGRISEILQGKHG